MNDFCHFWDFRYQNFVTLCPGGGTFASLFCAGGGLLYTMIVPEEGFYPLRVVSRGDGFG